jgi:uncharacterized protein YjbJ (UPF0337 family)
MKTNNDMNSGDTDKIQGDAKMAIGKLKQETGKVIGDHKLEARGSSEHLEGAVQKKVGEIKKVLGE